MTPERVWLHALLLESGDSRLLDAELAAALENESPLSDLTLTLSLCRGREEKRHALRAYLLEHPADLTKAERMLRETLHARLADGELSAEECLQRMHVLACDTEAGKQLALYADVCAVEAYRDLAAEGILCEEAYLLCLDALMKAEPLPDVWKLHREILRAKERERLIRGSSIPGFSRSRKRIRNQSKTGENL